jgi:ATP-binding cassette subfamily F protein 3
LSELETLIDQGERELGRVRAELHTSEQTEWEELHRRALEERALSERLSAWTDEWVKLSEELADPQRSGAGA